MRNKNNDPKKSRSTPSHADRVWDRLRLRQNRPMMTISIRLPEDVIVIEEAKVS